MFIRSGDLVEVRTGNDRGTRAKVLSVRPAKAAGGKVAKLVVEGVNRVYRHMKRSQKNPQGGRLSKEMPIDASNVLVVCPSCSSTTRIGVKVAADGGKVRVCRKCKAEMGAIRPPRAKKVTAKAGGR
jgi:large subunit ribosomal protein L24